MQVLSEKGRGAKRRLRIGFLLVPLLELGLQRPDFGQQRDERVRFFVQGSKRTLQLVDVVKSADDRAGVVNDLDRAAFGDDVRQPGHAVRGQLVELLVQAAVERRELVDVIGGHFHEFERIAELQNGVSHVRHGGFQFSSPARLGIYAYYLTV